ncbi:hypothetical protein MP228_012169 [Amoeboaphelidium protococcarum]|nr:hypothetical protein MP228_012169 [Amoeboaphelidium protococcarum]
MTSAPSDVAWLNISQSSDLLLNVNNLLLYGTWAQTLYKSQLVFTLYTLSVSLKIRKLVDRHVPAHIKTSWCLSLESLMCSLIFSFCGKIILELIFNGHGIFTSSALMASLFDTGKLVIVVACWLLVNMDQWVIVRAILLQSNIITFIIDFVNVWKRACDGIAGATNEYIVLQQDNQSLIHGDNSKYIIFIYSYLAQWGGSTVFPYFMKLTSVGPYIQAEIHNDLHTPSRNFMIVLLSSCLLAVFERSPLVDFLVLTIPLVQFILQQLPKITPDSSSTSAEQTKMETQQVKKQRGGKKKD